MQKPLKVPPLGLQHVASGVIQGQFNLVGNTINQIFRLEELLLTVPDHAKGRRETRQGRSSSVTKGDPTLLP